LKKISILIILIILNVIAQYLRSLLTTSIILFLATWDEFTMAQKKSLEALDHTLKDLRNNQVPFGGTLMILSGDFRHTLPVLPRSTPADELHACLKYSTFWSTVKKKMHLTKNMRVQHQNDPTAAIFSKQLLEIGNGTVPTNPETGKITFPSNFCIIVNSKKELVDKVFQSIKTNY